MKGILTLQISETDDTTYDAVVKLEDCLIEAFGSRHEVDGHDCGSGEINIFIFTDDHQEALKTSLEVIREMGLSEKFKAAYRKSDEEMYTAIWPEGYQGRFSVK